MPRKKKQTPVTCQMMLDVFGFHSTSLSFPVSPTTVINVPSVVTNPTITWVTPPPSPLTTPRTGMSNLATSFSDIIKATYKDTLAQMEQAINDDMIHQTVFGTGYIHIPDAIDLAEPPTFTVCPRCAQILHNHVKVHQHRFLIQKSHIIKGWWDGDKDVGSQPHYRQEDFKTIQIYGKDYEGFKAYVEACNSEEDK